MIELLNVTGYARIDTTLRGLIGLYETIFALRIRAYYLTGSYADGSATPDSDIDLSVIFAESLKPAEAERFRHFSDYCAQLTPVLLDCSPTDEATLQQGVKASLKNGLLLYGDPVIDTLPLEPLDEHIQRCMFLAFRYIHRLRGGPDAPLTYPLSYPDPEGRFFGYERFGSYLGGGDFGPGLRILVSAVTMMTSTLLALNSGAQVGTKQHSIDGYRQHIGGEWADLAADLYHVCKADWQYQIPSAPDSQQRLRDLCARLPAFENAFLDQCRDPLRRNLQHENPTVRHFAAEAVQRIALT